MRTAVPHGPFYFDEILDSAAGAEVVEVGDDVGGTVGRCIYCGSTEPPLSDEHIVPLGLGGRVVLRAASCSPCQTITGRFEQDVLRKAGAAFRSGMKMPTRRPAERPSSQRYLVTNGGVESELEVPIDDYIPMFGLPTFRPPAALTQESRSDLAFTGLRYIQPLSRTARYNSLEELGRGLGVEGIRLQQPRIPMASVARLAAKAAYGMCIAALGPDAFERVHVLPVILKGEEVGTWVGGADTPRFNLVEPGDHIITVDTFGGEVHSTVKLLAHMGGPEYYVVVGRLR